LGFIYSSNKKYPERGIMTTIETKTKKILMLAKDLAPKRGGRPRKKDQKNRDEVIKIRVSKQEKEILSVACVLLNMSYTSLLLDTGVENAKALLQAEGFKIPK
jgi:hypothetical protein